ncbi:MAG: hypothetical protein NT169_16030 [Chloroflexi bacterium]|nr:hypothetical protein [Chloroflexota bacterium]
MTVMETINRHLDTLPPERQVETLDFVLFLKQLQSRAMRTTWRGATRSLRSHPAFGSWRGRGVDALAYEHALRAEWDDCP